MHLGNINETGLQEKHFPVALRKAIEYLQKTDFEKIKNGKHFLEGEKMFVILDEYKTISRDYKKAEMHRKFIDVQFIISGEESMGFDFETENDQPSENYSPEKDVALYDKINKENYFTVQKNMYIVFYPGEIHRPGCSLEGEVNVRKAIVKISVDLL